MDRCQRREKSYWGGGAIERDERVVSSVFFFFFFYPSKREQWVRNKPTHLVRATCVKTAIRPSVASVLSPEWVVQKKVGYIRQAWVVVG
jgi:hypothetical protein